MGWFDSKEERLVKNLQEEMAYELAAYEISSRVIRPGLWAKAFAEASGDEKRARAIYIKLRVAQVKLGVEVSDEMIGKAEQVLPIKEKVPESIPSSGGVCRYCGGTDVARHSKTNKPTWCFSCKKDL